VLHTSEEMVFTPSGLDGMDSGRVATFINQIVEMVHSSKDVHRSSLSKSDLPNENPGAEDSDTDRSEDETRGSCDGIFGFHSSTGKDSESKSYWDMWHLWSCPLCTKITHSRSQLLKHVERCAHSRVSLLPITVAQQTPVNVKANEVVPSYWSVRNRVKKIYEKSMAADEMGSSSSVLQAKTRRRNYRRFTRRIQHPRFAEIVQIIESFIAAMEKRLGVLEDFELTPDGAAPESLDLLAGTSSETGCLTAATPAEEGDGAAKNFGAQMAWSKTSYSECISDFVVALHRQLMEATPAWDGSDTATLEGLERFLISRLYIAVFRYEVDDKEGDALLEKKTYELGEATHEQMHIPAKLLDKKFLRYWEISKSHLAEVKHQRCPVEKSACIENACQAIVELLQAASTDQSAVGADDIMPCIIWAIIHSDAEHLHSSIEFIQRFRHDGGTQGEAGYWLTQISSAISYISNVSVDDL